MFQYNISNNWILLCSYVAWNIHEPTPGNYYFDGDADLLSFIQLIQETGLLLVLRPGTKFTCQQIGISSPLRITHHLSV